MLFAVKRAKSKANLHLIYILSPQIIGDNTDKYCQAYFSYDSKKSGGFTCSHLRFGDTPIRSTYLVTTPNFVACHVQAYLHRYDVTRGLQKNGQFLLNTIFDDAELEKFLDEPSGKAERMPNKVKKYFAENNITVYTINATKIAQEIGQGKRIRKKDLGMIATTYGYVYVAQIAMGADHAQTLKAIREAEAWHGPSIVIAYAPCINNGLKAKGGMGKSQAEEKKAVECGYWHLWRYNPALAEEGKNPFSLDSKEPNWANFHDFLLGEVRYLSVKKAYPNEAEELFAEAQKMAQLRYKTYVRKTQENWEE